MPLWKSLILSEASLLSFSRICPAALWLRKHLRKRGTQMRGAGAGNGALPSSGPASACSFQLYYLFSSASQGYCLCLAGNFCCSPVTSCHRSSLLSEHHSWGAKEERPPSPNQWGDLHVEGPSLHRSEGWGNDLRLQILQVMPEHSYIFGKQEPAVLEHRTLLSAASTLKPSSVLIRDKFY